MHLLHYLPPQRLPVFHLCVASVPWDRLACHPTILYLSTVSSFFRKLLFICGKRYPKINDTNAPDLWNTILKGVVFVYFVQEHLPSGVLHLFDLIVPRWTIFTSSFFPLPQIMHFANCRFFVKSRDFLLLVTSLTQIVLLQIFRWLSSDSMHSKEAPLGAWKGEWLPADCIYVSSLLFLLRDDPSLKKINGEKESCYPIWHSRSFKGFFPGIDQWSAKWSPSAEQL